MKALGTVQTFYQHISEPEPGRVLVEQHNPWSVVAPAYLALSAEVAGMRRARAAA